MFKFNGEWKNANVDLQTLVAFFIGIGAIVGAVVGIQSWINNRILHHVRPLEQKVEELEKQVEENTYQNYQRGAVSDTNETE